MINTLQELYKFCSDNYIDGHDTIAIYVYKSNYCIWFDGYTHSISTELYNILSEEFGHLIFCISNVLDLILDIRNRKLSKVS